MQFTVFNTTSVLLELGASPLDQRMGSEHGKSTTRNKTKSPYRTRVSAAVTGQRLLQFDCVDERYLRLATDLDRHEPHTIQLTVVESAVSTSLSFKGFWTSMPGSIMSVEGVAESPITRQKLVTLASIDPVSGLDKYPALLASSLNVSSSVMPFRLQCLTDRCTDASSDAKRSGMLADRAQGLVRLLPSRTPTVLLLDPGLLDLEQFVANNHSSHDMDHFLDDFISVYTGFIEDVRWRLQERVASSLESGVISGLDASYAYNSAPSTLPIIVMTPFTASGRLRRLLGHACSAVVKQQREGGDISTHWIDTDGWLQRDDWVTGANDGAALSPGAHMKIAAFLSIHLCATLGIKGCPYHRPDGVLGKLYSPAEVDMERLLAERKMALIKEALKWS
jgi:hypothetical protein